MDCYTDEHSIAVLGRVQDTAGDHSWNIKRAPKGSMRLMRDVTGKPPVEAMDAETGKKLEEGLYKGTLRRGGHVAGCGCLAGEGGEPLPIQPITRT